MGAYTTRNAPAPENGDEIVAGPIERPITSHNTSNNTVDLRARRARDPSNLNIIQVLSSNK
jgi:hypothetical protein